MTVQERRQNPRTKVDGFAYLKIGPSNAGSVVNVSEGGLCFRAISPVHRNGTVRFSFSEHNHQIEGGAELAWTDGTQKSGGLRFTALPDEAQRQIRQWMGQAGIAIATEPVAEEQTPTPLVIPVSEIKWPELKPVSGGLPAAAALPAERVNRLRTFSGGLATGLMISALLAAAIIFQGYRRQFGEFLIELGERFAARPRVQTTAVIPTPQTVVPAPEPVSKPVTTQAQPVPPPKAAAPVERVKTPPPQTTASQPALRAGEPEELAPDVTRRVFRSPVVPANTAQTPSAQVVAAGNATPAASLAAAANPSVKAPSTPGAGGLSKLSEPVSTIPPPTGNSTPAVSSTPVPAADQPGNRIEESKASSAVTTAETFLEVGKFKDELQARNTTDKLAQLGFPATSVQKGWLWTNAYHVLVGPYEGDQQAKAARKNLATQGFSPHSFERGSRDLTLLSNVTLNGARVPVGDYTIRWESYVNDAAVKVERNSAVVGSAEGRWVKRPARFQRNAYMYRKNSDGSKTLLEIQFGGMNQALVFGRP